MSAWDLENLVLSMLPTHKTSTPLTRLYWTNIPTQVTIQTNQNQRLKMTIKLRAALHITPTSAAFAFSASVLPFVFANCPAFVFSADVAFATQRFPQLHSRAAMDLVPKVIIGSGGGATGGDAKTKKNFLYNSDALKEKDIQILNNRPLRTLLERLHALLCIRHFDPPMAQSELESTPPDDGPLEDKDYKEVVERR
ncbi:hypothetical protein BC827DRAFT_1272814 [Russula dissimulans]|nr:hypothetical protein BC827DRAFT_1273681 [Russula dissimulans]KAH9954175.1 hypothetical protein BC827DRAFT_1272814 [Russula dissimulans]